MLERCIMIFPEFSNISVIDEIRNKYDPLARHVRPHITLVFPFRSDIGSDELKQHIQNALSSVQPFRVTLKGITPAKSFGNYLFLDVVHGREEIVDIHKRLYTGLLECHFPQWLSKGSYTPHITVGKIDDEESYRATIADVQDIQDTFTALVEKISVEIIDENEDSIIEMEVPLLGDKI